MSNSNSYSPPLPTFSGNQMPLNISIDVHDDIGEEVTRRVGGGAPGATAMFTPSFEPMPYNTAMISTSQSAKTAPVPAAVESSWKVTDAAALPEFHPLERSAVFCPDSLPSEVAARLSAALAQLSIEAKFKKSEAHCISSEGVEFTIFLYKGKGQYSHGIIVEIQRRFGNSTNFQQDIFALFDAALGKSTSATKTKLPCTLPEEDDDFEVSDSSLEFVKKLFSRNSSDAQYLALQTLSSLTEPDKMGTKTAKGISNLLIDPQNEVGGHVLQILIDADSGKINPNFGMRLLAMTVLSNVFNEASPDNISPPLVSMLLPLFTELVSTADEAPQMAFFATKCLKAVLKSPASSDVCIRACLLQEAEAVGMRKHAGLSETARECQRLMR